MTAPSQSGLLATLPSSLPNGPAWLNTIREGAAATVREGGFPGKKHEAWRFTSVRDVVDRELTPVEGDPEAARGLADRLLSDDGAFRVVLANGRPEAIEGAPDGVTVRSLRSVLSESPGALEGALGTLARADHFAGLNAAMFEDGVVIEVAQGSAVETPIHLVYVATGSGAAHPRVLIRAGENSHCTVVETFVDADAALGGDPHLSNVVTEVSLAQAARLEHVRVTMGSPRAMQIAQLAVSQGRDSFYASRVVALGGKLGRLDIDVRLEGRGAETQLDGVYHVSGTDHVDHQIRVVHANEQGSSHVRYRGLLDGRGHAVFNAMGIAERDAFGTSAHQENRNLLLSAEARVDTKPHLEIDTDDIVASHGSTVGSLDEKQAFYLRSRGIPAAEARDLLTFAFVQELLDRIPHAPTTRRCTEAVLARLPHGERMREVLEP
ncbi:MAG: Fe-S cluster assembly protein SufD [Sandaracinaceae bacterium]